MKIDTNIVWGRLAVMLDNRTISLEPATLSEFDKSGGTQTVTVTAPSDKWTASASADWITATKEDGAVKIEVKAQEVSGQARTGSVIIKFGGVTKSIEIKQAKYTA